MKLNQRSIYLAGAFLAMMCLCVSTASAKRKRTRLKCKAGHKAKVLHKGFIKQATFRKSKGDQSCVTFDGIKKKNKKRKLVCLKKKSVKCTGNKKHIFKKGRTVLVRKKKKNVRAKVTSHKRGKYCVKYRSKAKLKDECVSISRVRVKRKKSKKGTASSGGFSNPAYSKPAKDEVRNNNNDAAPAAETTPAAEPETSTASNANAEDPKRCYGMRTGDDRSDCMISLMSPEIQPKVKAIVQELKAAGWKAVVHESRRDRAQQEKKCRDGHSKTMCSKHMCDNAADIIDRRYAWNIDTDHDFWKALGAATRKQGLEWGGDWKSFKDVAHIQTGKCTLSQLRKYGLTSCDCPK